MTAALPPYEDTELLARAFERGPDCPPLELLVAAGLGELPEAERARLAAHAEQCAACGAELALAAGCAAEEPGSAAVDEVVARLRGRAAAPEAGRLIDFPGAARTRTARERVGTRRPAPVWTRWAAAALLVLGVGLVWQANRPALPPALTGPATGDVVRGGEIEAVSPLGEVAGVPSELTWQPVAGAMRYHIELLDVGGETLGAGDSPTASWTLPSELAMQLHERASYAWRVMAFDGSGSELARSPLVEFSVRPAAR